MKFKKIILATILILLTQAAQAKVIELDALNSDHCRQQILDNRDQTGVPIFLVYWPTCENWQLFEKTFNQVSSDPKFSDRVFFRFNTEGNTLKAQKECLGLNGAMVSPIVFLTLESDTLPFSMPIKADGGVKQNPEHPDEGISITPDELEKIITIPGMTKNSNKGKNIMNKRQ